MSSGASSKKREKPNRRGEGKGRLWGLLDLDRPGGENQAPPGGPGRKMDHQRGRKTGAEGQENEQRKDTGLHKRQDRPA